MATLSAGDQTNLREKKHSSKFYFSALQPATLLSARVNNGSIARGDRSVAYDTGSSSDFSAIEAGQTLWVGTTAGSNDVGKVRIKSISGTATSGTITVDENGLDWGDDLHLTILHNYEPWAIPPRIDSGIFYKFYNITYSNQNSQPNPVAIAGPHQAGFLSGGSLILNVPVGDSYAVASGATISTKVVTVSPSAGSSVGAEAGGVIPITYTTAGDRWVKTVVTDSNGKTQTTYRVHFVYDANNLPYADFSVGNLSGDWQSGGWSFDVTISGDAALSDFPDGTVVLLWREGRIDDVESYVNVWTTGDNVVCSGYLQRDNATDSLESGAGEVSFSVRTPQAVLGNRTEMGPISIEAVSSPATWYQYASWLTVGRAVHHHLKWHSTVLEVVDIYGLLDNTLGTDVVEVSEDSLLARVNGLANNRGIFAKLVSDRLGRLHLVEDTQMFNETNRDAEDTVFSIVQQDLGGEVNIARQPEKSAALAFTDGFSFDGSTNTPFISISGGYIDGGTSIQIPEPSGTGSKNTPRQVVSSQADSNERCGRLLAAANNPLKEIRFPLRGDYMGAFDIVPSLGWYGWSVADATLKRNLALSGIKMLCRRLEHQLDVSGGTVLSSVICEAETHGPDGIPGNYPTSYPPVTLPEPNWTLPPSCEAALVKHAAAIFDTGNLNEGEGRLLVVRLSSAKCLVIFNDITAGSTGSACVLDISGDTITPGTQHDFNTTGVGSLSAAVLDSTNVLVTYTETNVLKGTILQISGSTVTSGLEYTIDASVTSAGNSVTTLTTTKAFSVYNKLSSAERRGVVLDISGTVITVNASQLIVSSREAIMTFATASNEALLIYQKSTTDVVARFAHSITTSFSLTSETTLRTKTNLDLQPYKSATLVGSGKYAVIYEDQDASPDDFNLFVGTFTGTTIDAPGSDTTYLSDNNAQLDADIVVLDDDATLIIAYAVPVSGNPQANCATVSGLTVTMGAGGFVDIATAISYPALAPVDSARAMVAYDAGATNGGQTRLLELG